MALCSSRLCFPVVFSLARTSSDVLLFGGSFRENFRIFCVCRIAQVWGHCRAKQRDLVGQTKKCTANEPLWLSHDLCLSDKASIACVSSSETGMPDDAQFHVFSKSCRANAWLLPVHEDWRGFCWDQSGHTIFIKGRHPTRGRRTGHGQLVPVQTGRFAHPTLTLFSSGGFALLP